MQENCEEEPQNEEPESGRVKVWEYCKRYLFLLVGLCIMSVGVVLFIKAALGTSAIS